MKFGRGYYFTEYTPGKGMLYGVCALYVVLCAMAMVYEPFVSLPTSCTRSVYHTPSSSSEERAFENPAYNDSACRTTRLWVLLLLTPEECSFGRRILASVLLGGVIGWERRQADRPAGIRTMALVALGSCLFAITSAFAFLSGPMNWDGSRVAAAIPSGVGFLGAGLIWKEAEKDSATGRHFHTVHGLTTAASVWLSAAVGIACGGELYFCASFSTAVMLLLLRFGPRSLMDDEKKLDDDHDDDNDDFPYDNNNKNHPQQMIERAELHPKLFGQQPAKFYESTLDVPLANHADLGTEERTSFVTTTSPTKMERSVKRQMSLKQRPQLL